MEPDADGSPARAAPRLCVSRSRPGRDAVLGAGTGLVLLAEVFWEGEGEAVDSLCVPWVVPSILERLEAVLLELREASAEGELLSAASEVEPEVSDLEAAR